MREFVLPYDDVRSTAAPDDVLHEFLQSTYQAAVNAEVFVYTFREGVLSPFSHDLEIRATSFVIEGDERTLRGGGTHRRAVRVHVSAVDPH